MLNKRIIPCLDILNGRVVKGINFLNLTDTGDPIKLAYNYYKEGADEIAFLDITASMYKRNLLLNIIKKISSKIFIPLIVGGGIKSLNDIENLLNSGADKISINTSAIKNPNIIYEAAKKYGSQCIIAAIDSKISKKNNIKWEVFTHGGRYSTNIDVIDWSYKLFNLGAGEILITSMDKDGTYNGFDIDLINSISNKVSIPIIASGGVGCLNDLFYGIKYGNANAVLAASIFHYKKFSIKEVKMFLSKKISLLDYE